MKIYNIEQRTIEWHQLRAGKVTGTGLEKLLASEKAKETYFYEKLAERLSVVNKAEEEETPMARGIRLEEEAASVFAKKTGKKVDRVGFIQSGFNQNIGYSPDFIIRKGKKVEEDIAVKCLSSGKHVRAWLEKKIPDDYYAEVFQPFIANEDLKTLYMVFYDPRITVKPYHVIEVSRGEAEVMAKEYNEKLKIESLEDIKKIEIAFLKRIEDTLAKIVKI